MNKITQYKRSIIMGRIHGKDTKPEITVRSLLHSMGYRFRLHKKDLPGKPDIVLPKYKTVVFVHGCFWHQHKDCRKATIPKTNTKFWKNKLEKNVMRDSQNIDKLKSKGWNVITVWECELKDIDLLKNKLINELTTLNVFGHDKHYKE